MPLEESAGVIIFRKEKNNIYYLLLNYASLGKVNKTYWGFVKGGIERGEKEIEAAVRETREETGIKDLDFIKGFREIQDYFFRYKNKTIFKKVYYLLAEVKTKEIVLSLEHIGYKWLLYEEAREQLSFESSKEILEKAHFFLKNRIQAEN